MEKNNTGGKNKIVETYAEDMVKVLEDDKSGLIKKIIHEEEENENEKEKKNLSPDSVKNRLFTLMGSLFILSSFATLFYFVLMRDIPVVPIERRLVSLIFHDTNNFIEIKDLKKKK